MVSARILWTARCSLIHTCYVSGELTTSFHFAHVNQYLSQYGISAYRCAVFLLSVLSLLHSTEMERFFLVFSEVRKSYYKNISNV